MKKEMRQILEAMANIKDKDVSGEEVNGIGAMISKAFDNEKISWKDYELLYKLIDVITE